MAKVKTVAIVNFESVSGISTQVSRECEESFRGHFINAGFNVVERSKMNSILKEHEISQSGIVGGNLNVAKLSGAQALLFGEVTQNKRQVKMVEYYQSKKNPYTGKRERIRKIKRMKFFTFQINIRLVSAVSGSTILTLKNKRPERSYEMTSRTTLFTI